MRLIPNLSLEELIFTQKRIIYELGLGRKTTSYVFVGAMVGCH